MSVPYRDKSEHPSRLIRASRAPRAHANAGCVIKTRGSPTYELQIDAKRSMGRYIDIVA
jgi:hypothetical protein